MFSLLFQPGPHILSRTGHLTGNDIQWVWEHPTKIVYICVCVCLALNCSIPKQVYQLFIVRTPAQFVCGSVANSQEVPVAGTTLQTAIVPWRHSCADPSVPGCLAAAWQDGAWTALHFPVLRPTSHILCTVRKSVEVWCKRDAPVMWI